MINMLSVGDKVLRMNRSGFQQEAVIKSISANCDSFGDGGTDVPSIPWDVCNSRDVIVDLEGGQWAWGEQLSPLEN